MPLINPIFGLPSSAVDRVADNEDRKRKERKKESQSEPPKKESDSKDEKSLSFSEEENQIGQLLDTPTMVKLIDAYLEKQKQPEHSPHSASILYNHVKNLTHHSLFNRRV